MPSHPQNLSKDEILGSNKFLHPKSRKCKAMVKKVKKESKKEKIKQVNKLKQSLVAEKLLWFQKHMDANIHPYTTELTASLVEKYMARNDDELMQIKLKRSIGGNRNRQHASREDAILITKEQEKCDYESCGLEIPDILNSTQCSMLKKWNGDLKFLPNFKLCRFKRHLDHELKKKQKLTHKEDKSVSEITIIGNESISQSESESSVSNNLERLMNKSEELKNEIDTVELIEKNNDCMDAE